ncbi:phosphonate ABC transporter, permease protein PhnE [Agromyces cerinus]|uniref:Phosphonate transport system permease protein n=1 Tax=Agromyces cerinus subsp. cerinus TaxID=232089 RepID=A0A1N6ESA6_9MICO|nr:phosphonate ABC transporter, permease protein PhnE [Agromyces cerinus]SIN85906.1 phosphonate transport system permease protein [Agromyces cerinus subsp. cerinus]
MSLATATPPAPSAPPPSSPSTIAERAPRRRVSPERIAAILTLGAIVVASVIALADSGISIPSMIESWGNAERFFARVGTITFPEPGELLYLTALTIGLVLCGTLLAAVISVPVAYLAASNTTPGRGWQAFGRFVTVLTRAIPDVVLAMVFVLMFSLGSLPGILAIGIHSVGMISKLFADAIEQIDEGPRLAIRAAGGSKLQEFTSGILPQVLPSWVATVLHRNDINLRGSVVLGYVGVVGLGMEMSFAFKSLNYSEGLGIALVMFALCVVMEIVSSVVRQAMLGGTPSGRGLGDRVVRGVQNARARGRATAVPAAPRPASGGDLEAALRRPWDAVRIRNTIWGWVALAVVIGSVLVCNIQWGDLVTFWAKIPAIAVQFWPPSFGNYDAATMFGAMAQTIGIALAATLLAFVVSVFVGSLAARNVAPNGTVRTSMRLLLVVIRGIPEVILAIVLIVITGLGSQAGTLALAFGGIGLLGKLIADSFEEVKSGPERALRATGANRGQVYASATLPQGTRALIGHSFYLLDTNIRAATILGIVGGGGIGYYLLNAGQGSNYAVVTAIVLMILVTVLIVEGIAMWMRRVFR